MDILLDTHAFIWFVEDSDELSKFAREIIENHSNDIYISIASLWEMSIKLNLKKLKLKDNFENIIDNISKNGFIFLPIKPEHTLILSFLSSHHRDPFDRILISQAQFEKMKIISKDPNFRKYDIKVFW